MGGLERAGDADPGENGLLPGHRPGAAEPVGEGAPRLEAHDQVGVARRREARGVDGDDVGMAGERSHRPQLAGQPAARLALEARLAEHLDRDGAAELGLPGTVDGAEAASPDLDGVLAAGDPEVDPGGGRSLLLATLTRPLHCQASWRVRGRFTTWVWAHRRSGAAGERVGPQPTGRPAQGGAPGFCARVPWLPGPSLTTLSTMAQLAVLIPQTEGHLRLVACPRCECRRRGITEVGGQLVGHCLRCGETLETPLEVENR